MIKDPELYPSFRFTSDELIQATTFNDLQLAYLQTMLAERVTRRLALQFDPTLAHQFLQEEAYQKGQIELLNELLLPPPSAVPTETTQE